GGFKRNFRSNNQDNNGGFKKKFNNDSEGGFKRNFRSNNQDNNGGFKKKFNNDSEGGFKRNFRSNNQDNNGGFKKKFNNDSEGGFKRNFRSNNQDNNGGFKKKFNNDSEGGFKRNFRSNNQDNNGGFKKKFNNDSEGGFKRNFRDNNQDNRNYRQGFKPRFSKDRFNTPRITEAEAKSRQTMRLNRYIAQSGVCSRREADQLIMQGRISVNGNVIQEMGYQVQIGDVVKYNGKPIKAEKLVYVLLNKPKDFITTTHDPQERRTVMDLVKNACRERIYPIGRLDRNTTGLLLLTNDGELAKKLSHPAHKVRKIYLATLDKPIAQKDYDQILAGIELEDGFIKADKLEIVTPDYLTIGIEIHSGRNHIVKRIFEHLGYQVIKLDRTVFANLTKKNVPRGEWRMLTPQEVILLKHFK
ncbi:MAG: rRNA pseudouridine synthase, partial [Cytophagales bacterium]